MSPTPMYTEPHPQRSGLMTALVAGALVALVAANIYLYVQVDHMRTEMAQMHDKLMTEISNIRDASSVTTASQMRHIETLKEELAAAREQARTAASQAKTEATARAEQLARQIESEQAQVQQKLNSQITDLSQSANQANQKIADVSSDIGNVKTQVATTQSDLQKTINDLKSVRGDLGVQSGLIATNASELAALKLRGERNYLDVKLGKTKQPVKFGDVMLQLKKADTKRNQYSVLVLADDKKTEKDNKSINEPVQFYTAKGGHIPYELVINQVSKDQIVGYLSTPKVEASR